MVLLRSLTIPSPTTVHYGGPPCKRRRARRQCSIIADAAYKPLVVVGSINADYVLSVDRLPLAGETLSASTLDTFPGGKGANQAAAAAKLGFPTYMIGQVGSEGPAAMLRAAMTSCGVDDSYVREVSGPCGTAVILLQPSGENSIIIVGGANTCDWEVTPQMQQLLASAGLVLLQREIPEQVNVAVAKVASAAGVRVVLDAGGQEGPLDGALLANITILSPNETELARMTGLPTDSREDLLAAARKLLDVGVSTILVKLGSDGALLLQQGQVECIQVPAFQVDKVVDTTGAGDCFTASFCVGLLEGRDYADAMRFAAAAAAVCVQRKGAIPSLPTRQEAESQYCGPVRTNS